MVYLININIILNLHNLLVLNLYPCFKGQGVGQEYYENLCMKAVNQSIGRSVRHQQDYAAVLLLDYRYQRDNIKNSLSKWLQPSLQIHTKFGSAFSQLNKVCK